MEVQQQLSIGLKHLLPLQTKLDLKSFVKHAAAAADETSNSPKTTSKFVNVSPVGVQSGGTRWNPTQEQIRALEALYKSGMRTPNANQIERITDELGRYGKIEGKNVFYWFQNHKARERQKQKRSALLASESSSPTNTTFFSNAKEEERREKSDESKKRRCRSWTPEPDHEESDNDRTLELFPLHPELGR